MIASRNSQFTLETNFLSWETEVYSRKEHTEVSKTANIVNKFVKVYLCIATVAGKEPLHHEHLGAVQTLHLP